MKIRLVKAELFRVDRQMGGHDEADSRFSQFCERSLKYFQPFEIVTREHIDRPAKIGARRDIFRQHTKNMIKVKPFYEYADVREH